MVDFQQQGHLAFRCLLAINQVHHRDAPVGYYIEVYSEWSSEDY